MVTNVCLQLYTWFTCRTFVFSFSVPSDIDDLDEFGEVDDDFLSSIPLDFPEAVQAPAVIDLTDETSECEGGSLHNWFVTSCHISLQLN